MKPKTSRCHFLALAGSSLLAFSYSHAATVNWQGDTSNLWATAGNWDAAPANSLLTDIVNFNLATYGGNPVWAPTVGTATSINGITIGASNGTMTLTNTAALSIGASGISIANGAGAFTISGSTTLGASQSWTNNSASLFTFGAVTNGANLLTIGGSGNTTASGIIGNGAGGLTKEGAGLLTLNAANTYTGATTVNGGELRWGIANAIAGGALNINNGGTVNMQTFSDTVGTVTIAQGGSITGTTGILTTGSGGLVSNDGGTISGFSAGAGLLLGGGITYNSTGPGSTTLQIDRVFVPDLSPTFNIANGDAAIDFEITGTLSGGGNNIARNLTKTGAGVMQLSGSQANTTGTNQMPLAIWDGTVIFNKSAEVNALPNSAITIGDGIGAAVSAMLQYRTSNNQIENSAITINSDGLFDLNGRSETTSGALTLNSTGQLQLNNGQLTVGSLTLNPSAENTTSLSLGASGTLTLGGDVTLNAAGTGRAQITGSALSLGAANRIFNIGLGSGADYDMLVGAGISGATRSLTKNGTGRLVLTGSNSYTGGTTVNAGTLQIGDGTTAGTMASTGALTLGNATFRVLAPTSGSSSQTVASLATSTSTGSTIRVTPGTTGNTTFTITGTGLSTGAGSSLNFDYTAGTTVGGTVGNNYVTWNPTLTGGIIGGAYTVTDSGGTGFATTSGGNVVRLTDSGSASLPVSTGSATGSYFIRSGYSTDSTTTPGSLVQALSGAVAASNVTVNTTGLASAANLALGTNLLTLGAGIVFDGPNAYEITGSGAGGLRAASAGGTINLYNANISTVTISAPIVNNTASRLTVDGPGTTILSGVNTYTGATVLNGGITRFSGTMAASPITINNGVAQLGTATGLTSSNTVTFGAGSTGSLQLRGNDLSIGALSSNAVLGTPVITNNNGGPSVANATLTINSASASSFGGVIQDGTGGGTLALTNSGAGTLTLTGVNTYSGGTTINAGIVSVISDANLGAAGVGITLAGGQLLAGGNNISSARSVTVNGTGSSMRVAKNNNITTSGALNGAGAITFVDNGGSGTNSLYNFTSSGSTFTGAMTLQAVNVGVTGLGDAFGNNLIFTGAGTFSLFATGATNGLTFNNRAIELSNASATISNLNTTHAITIGSNLVATGAVAKVLTLSAVAGPTNVFGGSITDGTGGGTVGLTKSGAGTWVIGNSANTYTGTTTFGGTLIINALSNYGSASSLGAAATGNIIFDKNLTSTLIYMGDGDTTNRTIRHEADVSNRNNGSGLFNNGSGALIFNGSTFNTPFVASGNSGRTTVFNLGGTYAGSANQIGGVIADNDATSFIGITKTGIGTWTLGGANTFTGATTISGGTLGLDYSAQNNSKLSNTAALNVGAFSSTLNLSGGSHNEIIASTSLANGAGLWITRTGGTSSVALNAITRANGQNAITLSADSIASTDQTNTNGILGGWATVGSNWAVNSTNGADGAIVGLTSYTTSVPTTGGSTTANYQLTGGLTLTGDLTGNSLRLVNGADSDELDMGSVSARILTPGAGHNAGILYAGGFNDNYTIKGAGTIRSATANNTLNVNVHTGTLTVNARLNSGSAATMKYGAGTLVIGGDNTSSGPLWILDGTARFTHNNAAGTTAGATVVQNGAALELANSIAIGAEALTITGTGSSNAGALRNVASNTSSYAGAITIGTGGARINSDNGASLTLTGGMATSLYNDITFGGAGNTTIATTAITGSGSVIKDGAGTVTLTGANTYSGTTSVTAGTLQLGDGTSGNDGTIANTSGLVNNGALVFNSFGSSTASYAISGTGGLTKAGIGTLTLTGTNTYTGATTINNGILQLSGSGSINGSDVTVNGGSFINNSSVAYTGTLTLNNANLGGGTIDGDITYSGGGTVSGSSTVTGSVGSSSGSFSVQSGANLTVGTGLNVSGTAELILASTASVTGSINYSSSVNSTIEGVIAGSSQTLTKSGNSTLTLTGTNTYTGATTVDAGKLVVNGNISSSSLTSVASGATIGGSGTVGELTVSSGGFINPGNSPGILNVSGDYTQAGLYTAEITGLTAGTEHDQINVTGSVDITGGSLTALFTSGTYAANDLIFILLNDGVDAITGTYSGLAQGATVIEYDGFDWKISYTANSTTNSFTGGNDIALMAIPEPKAALLGGLGLLLLLRRRR